MVGIHYWAQRDIEDEVVVPETIAAKARGAPSRMAEVAA